MQANDAMNPRTCIVTRSEVPADEMIRFVLDPDNQVTPDLRRKLPGRGVWVTATRKMVDEAVSRKLFKRGFRSEVVVDPELGEQADRLLCSAALASLSIAKKAGLVVSGHAKVDKAVRSGKAVLLIHALDAAPDGIRKLQSALLAGRAEAGSEINVRAIWPGDELDKALGGGNLVHLAVLPGGATKSLIERLNRVETYRQA